MMKKILSLLVLTSFISLAVLAEEPVKSCDSKKEGKSCCKKETADSGKSCCSKDAAAKSGSCSKDAKAGCSHDKEAAAKQSGCSGHDHGKAEVKSDK